jgi:hypothetical protein
VSVLSAQSKSVALDIKKWDGSDKIIDLNSLRKITFAGGNLVLNYQSGSTESVVTSSVRKLVFASITGVNDVSVENNALLVFPNPGVDFISLKNVSAGVKNIGVYSICGIQVMNLQHYSNNDRIDISGLTKGIYIIKVNNQALKFTKL